MVYKTTLKGQKYVATIHHWAQALGFVRGSASRLWLRVTLGLLNTDVENPIVLRSENGLHSWDMFNVYIHVYIYTYLVAHPT